MYNTPRPRRAHLILAQCWLILTFLHVDLSFCSTINIINHRWIAKIPKKMTWEKWWAPQLKRRHFMLLQNKNVGDASVPRQRRRSWQASSPVSIPQRKLAPRGPQRWLRHGMTSKPQITRRGRGLWPYRWSKLLPYSFPRSRQRLRLALGLALRLILRRLALRRLPLHLVLLPLNLKIPCAVTGSVAGSSLSQCLSTVGFQVAMQCCIIYVKLSTKKKWG